jgi:hypothetical protein
MVGEEVYARADCTARDALCTWLIVHHAIYPSYERVEQAGQAELCEPQLQTTHKLVARPDETRDYIYLCIQLSMQAIP